MSKTIDKILDFFDTTKDLDKVEFKDQLAYQPTIIKLMKVQWENIASMLSPLPKYMIRGTIPGALTGSLMGALKGKDIEKYILAGAMFGMSADGIQYVVRAGYKFIKTQIYSNEEP